LVVQIVQACRQALSLQEGEISMEANPGTVNAEYLAGLRGVGVNRLSLGVQSFAEAELKLLGRLHDTMQAEEAFSWARAAGFDNINIDLIFGLPGQGLEAWRRSLSKAVKLAPEHLSLYHLTLDEATPLAQAIARGEFPLPDTDLAADMYLLSEDMLREAGYEHYEISNWAKPGRRCQHNLIYWKNQPYLGLGAGAHSYLDGCRFANMALPLEYIQRLEQDLSPIGQREEAGEVVERAETMFLGLRLTEGIGEEEFAARFGSSPSHLYSSEIAELRSLGLLEQTGLRLSRQGRLLGNEVFLRFLAKV
ncbi:MAG: radical SAM family heme chaperone HemW, partial [Chloroflexota bacterium]